MPLLRLSKERFDPHLPFAHRLLVGLGRVIAAHLLQVVGMERPMHDAPVAAFRATLLEWAGVAGRGMDTVDNHSLGVLDPLTN